MITALVLALLIAQQVPPRDTRPLASTGAASISGKVVDAQTGEPIGGAVLSVGELKLGVRSLRVDADERGAFEVTGLKGGDYVIYVSPPELHATYLPAMVNGDLTQLMLFQRKPSLTLKEGEQRTDLVVKMERALVIEGRVVDEYGEPMADIQVSAEPLDGRVGGFGGGDHYTDDRGMFRVYGLAPGAYRVCGMPSGFGNLMSRPASGDVVERRYVKTCYPSAPEGGGERVTVSASSAPAVTIVMQRITGYTISGRARSESGATDVHVNVARQHEGNSSGSVSMEPDGRFTVRGVTPGDYVLTARAAVGASGPFGERRTMELARVSVRVEASDITGLDLVATKGVTLMGRIVPDGHLPASTKLHVRQANVLTPMMSMDIPQPAAVGPDLTFEMSGVHDPLLLDVTGLPTGWVVTSVRYQGSDIVETPTKTTTTTDPSELEVVVSPQSSSLTARAVDAAGQLVTEAFVLLVPTKNDRAIQPRNVGLTPQPTDVPFELPPVRPGEYLIVGVRLVDLMQAMRGGDGVASLRKLGVPITLKAGEKRTVDVVVRTMAEIK